MQHFTRAFQLSLILLFSLVQSSIVLAVDPPTVVDVNACSGNVITISPTSASGTPTELATLTFDDPSTDIGYTPSIMFNDGVNDHFNLTDGSDISNTSGPYDFGPPPNNFWAAEDTDDNGGDGQKEQSLTLDAINISNSSGIDFSLDFAAGNANGPGANRYDRADYVYVMYSIDGGTPVRLMSFIYQDNGDPYNEPLYSDPNNDGDVSDGVQITPTAMNFSASISAADLAGGTNIVFSILVRMDAAGEEIAFDNIKVEDTGSSDPISYNFYDANPTNNPSANLLAGSVLSYNPSTTLANSPQTFWVTAVQGADESSAVPVVVTVLPQTSAGTNQYICGSAPVQLSGVGDMSLTPTWSGGMGVFSDVNSFNPTYTPADTELGTPVVLTMDLPGATCDTTATVTLFAVQSNSAEFSYATDSICPGTGTILPNHVTGIDGFYSCVSNNAADLILDSSTGAVDLSSPEGSYTIKNTVSSCGNLMITGVIDGPLSGGVPKAIELLAVNDITDLSVYGVGSANNGGGSDGIEFTFPKGFVAKGTYIYLASEATGFNNYFGFEPDYTSFAMLINGDDAIELFCDGTVIDVFGDINVDGTNQTWEYLDGWAYRINNDSLNLASFDDTQWTYSGKNVLDGSTTNVGASNPFPIGTYATSFMGICPNAEHTETLVITDFGGPMVNCPADITINLLPGQCGRVTQLLDASVLDNCSGNINFQQISGPMSGDFLNKKDAPYTVEFKGVSDLGVEVFCSYQIFVNEFEPTSQTMACNNQINLSLDASCEVRVGADMMLEGNNYGCYDDYILSATLNGSPVGIPVANSYGTGNSLIFGGNYLNQAIKLSVQSPDTDLTCWGYLTIEDKTAPQIVCQDTITVSCDADVSPTTPTVIENCGAVVMEFDEEILEGECNDAFFKQIIRRWIAIDAAGNRSNECTQVINIERDTFADLQFPKSYDGLSGNHSPLSCDGANSAYAVNEKGLPSPVAINGKPGTGVPQLGAGCSKLITHYEDVVIPTCGASYKVIRNWLVIDWCTGEKATSSQIIKVLDTAGPSFDQPSDVTISVDNHCRGIYSLPLFIATDNCSDNVNTYYTANEGEIDGSYFNVESVELLKKYAINAVAEDACGNKTEKTFYVRFVDKVAPIINAESSRTVALSLDGTAKLFAKNFDDGSYDNCGGPINIQVARTFSTCDAIDYDAPAGDDNFQFNDVVHFCCADIGTPQMVTIRVCDDANGNGKFEPKKDNCNTAMVEVHVQSKLAPVIICPAPKKISCTDAAGLDFDNETLMNNLFGEAQVMNSCGGDLKQSFSKKLNCGSGEIFRTFTATANDKTSSCTQVITVEAQQDEVFSCKRISFKHLNNNTYNWCSVGSGKKFPAIEMSCNDGLEVPELDIDLDGLCTEIGVKINVDTFDFAGGACKKFLVHYEVINQCIFEENFVNPVTGEIDPYHTENGYYEMYIEINAFDSQAPVFEPKAVKIAAEECDLTSVNILAEATDGCTDPAFLSYSYKLDLDADGSIDFPTNGWIASNRVQTGANGLTKLPLGVHHIYWLVDDGCGNTTAKTQVLTITNNEKEPTPICHTGLNFSISAMGMVDITARQLDLASTDNCSSNLRYAFSTNPSDSIRTYDCNSLGFQFAKIYVFDEDGNSDYCTAFFIVQDNGNFCSSSNPMISGTVGSTQGYMNELAEVSLFMDTMVNMVYTNDKGTFAQPMSDLPGAYLKAEDNQHALLGVSTLDIVLIQKHILGIAPFEQAEQLIAADVNNDQKINGSDLIQIRKLILGYYDAFPNHTSWVTYPANFDLNSLANVYDYPQKIMIHDAAGNYSFNSIKIADVNATHSANVQASAQTRSIETFYYESRTEDDLRYIDVYGNPNELLGLSFDWDTKAIVQVLAGQLDIDARHYNAAESFKLSWSNLDANQLNETPLFTLVLESDSEFDLNSSSLNSSAIIGKEYTRESTLRFEARSQDDLLNIAVYPNPFVDKFQIDLGYMPSGKVELRLFASNGVLVSETASNGSRIVEFDLSAEKPGLYRLQVVDAENTIQRNIIKIR